MFNAFNTSMYKEEPEHPEWAPELLERIVHKIGSVITGQEEAVRMMLAAMLAGGHVLLEDVPGVGKTMLVRAAAAVLGCDFGRIQFTYDLVPGDITGTSVYSPRTGLFEFRPGPVLSSHMMLADEINRASPRAQSALLEAMEEGRVTVDGTTYSLPSPFFLMATQNPYEFEGTSRLPEAQMDRFMMRLSLGYPAAEHELLMLDRDGGRTVAEQLKPLTTGSELSFLQRSVTRVHVDESIKKYLVSVADASRRLRGVRLGVSPRGTLAWMRASQAVAFMDRRTFVLPDDCLRVAGPVLAHRIQLDYEAKSSSITQQDMVNQLIRRVELPHQRSRKGGRHDERLKN